MALALTTCSTEGKMDNIAYTVPVLTLPSLEPTLPADYFLQHSSASPQPPLSQPSASHQPASAIPQPAFSQPSASLQPVFPGYSLGLHTPVPRQPQDSRFSVRFEIQLQDLRSSHKIQDLAARFEIQAISDLAYLVERGLFLAFLVERGLSGPFILIVLWKSCTIV